MGKGAYNQDLAPRSVLLEFGTHTLSKDLVLRSAKPMSEVVYKALFGGVVGSAGVSDTRGSSETKSENKVSKPATEDNTGSSWIIWLIFALIIGLGIFAFLSTGGRGGLDKWGRSISEMTGGFLGKKPGKGK